MIPYYLFFGLIAFLISVFKFKDVMDTTDYFVVLGLCLLIWPVIVFHATYLIIFGVKENDE
jgi:phosphate starvation-inducible membrane PsiE